MAKKYKKHEAQVMDQPVVKTRIPATNKSKAKRVHLSTPEQIMQAPYYTFRQSILKSMMDDEDYKTFVRKYCETRENMPRDRIKLPPNATDMKMYEKFINKEITLGEWAKAKKVPPFKLHYLIGRINVYKIQN